MGNLGGYEKMTTIASKVGGPIKLFSIISVTSAALGAAIPTGVGLIKKLINSQRRKKKAIALSSVLYTVHTETSSKEGLTFKKGDQFKIIELNDDTAQIEIIGKDCNPYLASFVFLQSIADFSYIG